jgi:heat shock protein HslJ
MTARTCTSRYRQQLVGILFLLTVCAGLACAAVSVGSAEQHERQATAAADAANALEGGPWLLLEVNGAVVQLPAGDKQPYILFQRQEGRVKGYSGCNEFSGSYDLRGDVLTFGLLAMTRRYCSGAAGEVEREFVDVLSKVRGWHVDRQMLLMMDGGLVLARLRQEQRSTQQ